MLLMAVQSLLMAIQRLRMAIQRLQTEISPGFVKTLGMVQGGFMEASGSFCQSAAGPVRVGCGRQGNKMNSGKKPYCLFPLLHY